MRHIISIIVSVVLVFSTCWCFSTAIAEGVNSFEVLSNWIMGDQTNTEITHSSALEANRELVTDSAVPGGISDASIKFYRSSPLRGSIKLTDLKPDTDYRLTVSFYSENYSETNNCIIREAGIFTPNVEGANLRWQTGGYKGYLNVMTYNVTQRSIPDAISYSSAVSVDSALNTTVTNYPTSEWNSLVFTFNTKQFEDIYFTVLMETKCTVYIDNMAIEEYNEFEKLSNLIMGDQTSTEIANVDKYNSAKSVVSGVDVPLNGSNFATKLYYKSNPLRSSLKLESLDANTNYRLTVSFYSDNYSTSNNCIIREAGIFTPDAENANLRWQTGGYKGYLNIMTYNTTQRSIPDAVSYSSATAVDSARNTTVSNYPTGKWNSLVFTFNTANFENIYLTMLAETNCTVYISDIKVEKYDYFEDATKWIMGDQTNTAVAHNTNYETAKIPVGGVEIPNKNSAFATKFYRSAGPLRGSIKLENIEPNTDYRLTVAFYSDNYSTSNNCIIREAGIFTSDVDGANLRWQSGTYWTGYLNVLTYNTNQIYMSEATYSPRNSMDSEKNLTVTNNPTGVWNTVTFTFNSGDFQNIYFTSLFETGCTVYLDNLSLEKLDYYNSFSNWIMGDQTSTSISEIGKYDTLRATVNNEEKNSVIKFYRQAGPLRASLKLENLLENTDYTVKLSFYSDDFSESNNCTLRQAGIFTTDVDNSNLIWQSATGWTGYLNIMAYNTTQVSMPGAINSTKVPSDSNTNTSVNNYPIGEWNNLSFTFNSGDFTNIYFTTLIETNCVVYFKDITVTPKYTGATAYNSAAALRAASNTDGKINKNGMRIYNSISIDWIDSASIIEYGSIASFEKKINGSITLENAFAKGVAYSQGTKYSEAKEPVIWETREYEGLMIFTSYLTGINPTLYDENVIIRTYAIRRDENNQEQVIYGNEISVCVFDVANAIDNCQLVGGAVRTEVDVDAFKAFVTNSKETDAEYVAWCDANGKALGDLYGKYHMAE